MHIFCVNLLFPKFSIFHLHIPTVFRTQDSIFEISHFQPGNLDWNSNASFRIANMHINILVMAASFCTMVLAHYPSDDNQDGFTDYSLDQNQAGVPDVSLDTSQAAIV